MSHERTQLAHQYHFRRVAVSTRAACTEDVTIRNLYTKCRTEMRGGGDWPATTTGVPTEIHARGRGVVYDRDGKETEQLAWTISWRHLDAAFEEQLVSTDTNNRALGSAYAIGFTGTSSGLLWQFEECSTTTIDGDERDEIILVSVAQNGNILLEALRAFVMGTESEEAHARCVKVEGVTALDDNALACTLRVANGSAGAGASGVAMLVELRGTGASDAESEAALMLTLRPRHVCEDNASEFSWSERRIIFGCSKDDFALRVRRVEIDGADGRLLSRFIVDEHVTGPLPNPASLPLPESMYGVDSVLSIRTSRYTQPEAALVPETTRFVELDTCCDAVLSVNGKIFVEPLFGAAEETCGEFIVDSGASCSLINKKIINMTHIIDDKTRQWFELLSDETVVLQGGFFASAGAGSEASKYYRCTREMNVCGMTITQQRFVSFDFANSPLSGLSSGWKSNDTEVAGLIGSDILSRAVVVMRAPNTTSDIGGRWGERRVECYDPRTYDASAQGTTRWVRVEMIGGIPHLLCRCYYGGTKQRARGTVPVKGFGVSKPSLRQDTEKGYVDVWLGVDSAFNNASVAKVLSVFMTDEMAVKLVASFPRRGGSGGGDGNPGSPAPSISASMSYVGMLDNVAVLCSDTGSSSSNDAQPPVDGALELGEARFFVTKAAMAKANRRGKRRRAARDDSQSQDSLCSGGMLSSTLFARRTVVLDFARRRIGFMSL